MVEEIRVMWCDTLEEILQCPVCLDVPQGLKYQCINGHHICDPCKTQLIRCPICKSEFICTRNLAVEQIAAKLSDIKLSLIHPYHALNRKLLQGKVCVATQTEEICMSSTSSACQTDPDNQVRHITPKSEQQKSINLNLAPRVGKGPYPCCIGSCTMNLVHGRIIGHLRYYHKDVFYEFTTKDTVFKEQWSLEYISNRDYDFAFHIKEMGLFFLNITINQTGDLMATVQIVNGNDVGKQFSYTFETVNPVGTLNACYTGQVKSCRIARKSLLPRECLHIRKDAMRHIIDGENIFHCNLIIKRRIAYKSISVQDSSVPLSGVLENIANSNMI